MAEFQQDFYPEFERLPETIVLPDGEEVEAAPILLDAVQPVRTAAVRASKSAATRKGVAR